MNYADCFVNFLRLYRMIYLDNNATTLMPPEVMRAMIEWSNRGNPSSGYASARAARRMMTEFREYIGYLCGIGVCCPEERDVGEQSAQRGDSARYKVIFTSGASEANCCAVESAIEEWRARSHNVPHVIVGATEHKSILLMLDSYEARGICQVTRINPGLGGHTLPGDVSAALKPNTALVCVMHANNETGALNDIGAIGRITREAGVHFHCDTVQSFGKYPLNPATAGVDSFSISFHKFYGPPGVGALVIRQARPIIPLVYGTQNEGLRGGTENLPGIGAALVATRITMNDRVRKNARLLMLKSQLMQQLRRIFPNRDYANYNSPCAPAEIIFISGESIKYLPNTLLLSVVSTTATICNAKLKEALEADSIIISVGSACNTSSAKASHVLYAMGADEHIRRGALRISLGDTNTEAEIAQFVRAFARAVSDQVSKK